jgi:hypothetical protein
MLNVDELVGMTERSGVRKIENARFVARILSRDGVVRLTPGDDVDNERVNLEVIGGEIVKAWLG